MDKKTIEEADLMFVTKLDELRSSLSDRRRRYENKQKRPFCFPVILILILILFAVYWSEIFSKKENPPQPEESKLIVATDISSALAPPVQLTDNICESNKNAISFPKSATVEYMPMEDDNSKPSSPDRIESVNAKRPEKPNLEAKKLFGEQKIKLASVVACKGVRNRQYLDETNVFHISETAHTYIWMEVKSEKQPFVLKHVYYFNGEKYCDVPLKIKYPRMRTWSYVTLKNPDHIGRWQVEVTGEDGEVLKQIRFEVMP